jgi:hypothetical protein
VRPSLFVLIAVLAAYQTASAKTMVYGLGNASCGRFLEARAAGPREPEAQVFVTWLTGYMTALVQQFPNADQKIAASDPSAWAAWIDNYCRQNPTDAFYDATYALSKFLLSRPE